MMPLTGAVEAYLAIYSSLPIAVFQYINLSLILALISGVLVIMRNLK